MCKGVKHTYYQLRQTHRALILNFSAQVIYCTLCVIMDLSTCSKFALNVRQLFSQLRPVQQLRVYNNIHRQKVVHCNAHACEEKPAEIPKVALAYAGCSDDGQVICWTTSASLLPYLKSVSPGVSSNRLMAEQKILGVAAGDLHYPCMSLKVKLVINNELLTVYCCRKWSYQRQYCMD